MNFKYRTKHTTHSLNAINKYFMVIEKERNKRKKRISSASTIIKLLEFSSKFNYSSISEALFLYIH